MGGCVTRTLQRRRARQIQAAELSNSNETPGSGVVDAIADHSIVAVRTPVDPGAVLQSWVPRIAVVIATVMNRNF